MATITSAASGDFTAGATWVGGVAPGPGDIAVAASGHTITIDADVTVTEFQSTGGTFILGNGRTITGNIRNGAAAVVQVTSTTEAQINGTIIGSNGDQMTVSVTGSGTLTIIGDINGGATNDRRGLSVTAPATVFIIGDLIGGSGSGAGSSHALIASAGSIHVTGSLLPGGGNTTVNLTGTASISIVGDIVGNAIGSSAGLTSSASGAITVTGSVTSRLNGAGILQTGNSASKVVSVIGTVTAVGGNVQNGILDSNAWGGWTEVGGSLIDSPNGSTAVCARRFRCIETLNTIRQHSNAVGYPNGDPVIYGSLDYIPAGIPTPSDVRTGVVYGDDDWEGALEIPDPSAVKVGVPVDGTIGTGLVTLADVVAITGAQIAAATNGD
jgi:hypothetical protein